MHFTAGKCVANALLDVVSELMMVPMLLIDGSGNPLYRSRYYFCADLTRDAAGELRRALAYAGDVEAQRARIVRVFGMEAIVAPVHGHGETRYLVAGYFIAPEQQDSVLQQFGPELGQEMLQKNLAAHWCSRKTALVEMVAAVAYFLAYDLRISNLLQVIKALSTKAGLRSDVYWQGIFTALKRAFPVTWAAVVFFDTPAFALVWKEGGYVQRVEPFACPLSDWVRATGASVQIDNLVLDLRGEKLLTLYPPLEALTSIPFPAGASCHGVLHLAGSSPLCSLDVTLLEQVTGRLAENEGLAPENVRFSRLESALDAIMKVLSGGAQGEPLYPMLLNLMAKALQCRSAAIYLKNGNGEFQAAASLQMEKPDIRQDYIRLRQVYGQNTDVMQGVLSSPQGGGYWEMPICADRMFYGVLVLRGCHNAGSSEVRFARRVADLLGCFLERQKSRELVHGLEQDLVESLLMLQERHLPWLRCHGERTAVMVRSLAQVAGFSEEEVNRIYTAALLHNIGKVRLPIELLDASRALTPAESQRLRRHGQIGAELLSGMSTLRRLSAVLAQLEENVDGSGYPDGLQEAQIHEHARIIRVISMFVALVMDPPYGQGLTQQKALRLMGQAAGIKISRRYFKLFRNMITTATVDGAVADIHGSQAGEKLGALTARELEVLQMIAAGKPNAEIAGELCISEKTVKIHVSNLFQKLGVKDRTQAAIYYLTQNETN